MRLTQTLLGFLNRVFRKDPVQFLALRFSYAAEMTWQVQDAVLTTSVPSNPAADLSIDLSAYTLSGLAAFLAGQSGYTVSYLTPDYQNVSALVLIDAAGDPSLSNGDHLYGYTSLVWAYFDACAVELQAAAAAIAAMPAEMSTTTADGYWLDVLGSQYNVPRLLGETDVPYGARIIAETILPRGNNVAIEAAIKSYTGQTTTVTDVIAYSPVAPLLDGSINADGSHLFNASSSIRYGLFDVVVGYDILNGGSLAAFQSTITDLIGRLRDAGTQLRSLSLAGSSVSDTAPVPTDSRDSLVISTKNFLDGTSTFSGSINLSGTRLSSSNLTA